MRENCNYIDGCKISECSSPYLDVLYNLDDSSFYLQKDRSISRIRHFNKVKSKQRHQYTKNLQQRRYAKARRIRKRNQRLKKRIARRKAKRK